MNQSEEQLLDISSFHSDQDSLDISEKHLNDESFKLANHAFSKVQTMDQINVRHEEDERLLQKPNAKISKKHVLEYQKLNAF